MRYRVHEFKGYRRDKPQKAESLGSFRETERFIALDETDGDVYITVPCASGSDYSGSLVERANFEYLKEAWGDWPAFIRLYGGYGTFGVMLNLGHLTPDQLDRVRDIFESIERYPVIDDDMLYKMEHEATLREVSENIVYDLKRELETRFPELEALDLEPAAYEDLFWAICRRHAEAYFYNELADSMVLEPRLETILDQVDVKETAEYWALFPADYDHGLESSGFDPRQRWFDLTLFGFPTWAPYVG